MLCSKCKSLLTKSTTVLVTADGSGKRKNPICSSCHEHTVRGIGRGRTGAAIDVSIIDLRSRNQEYEYEGDLDK